MFNNTGIKKETGGAPVQILFNVQHQMSVSIKVAKAAGTTADGKTIVKAGTPLHGDLTNRATAFVTPVKAAEGVTAKPAVGVLLHDVDVTDGENNGSLLIWGFVNLNRLDTATKAKITADITKDLNGRVWFLSDN